jgi:hypothetical protein
MAQKVRSILSPNFKKLEIIACIRKSNTELRAAFCYSLDCLGLDLAPKKDGYIERHKERIERERLGLMRAKEAIFLSRFELEPARFSWTENEFLLTQLNKALMMYSEVIECRLENNSLFELLGDEKKFHERWSEVFDKEMDLKKAIILHIISIHKYLKQDDKIQEHRLNEKDSYYSAEPMLSISFDDFYFELEKAILAESY